MSYEEIKRYRARLLNLYGINNLRWAIKEVGLLKAGALLHETFGRTTLEDTSCVSLVVIIV